MIKKSRATFTYFLFMFGAIFGIICVVFALPPYLCIADGIICIIAAILVLQCSYCPFCGKYGVKIKPFQKEVPFCEKCGKEQP